MTPDEARAFALDWVAADPEGRSAAREAVGVLAAELERLRWYRTQHAILVDGWPDAGTIAARAEAAERDLVSAKAELAVARQENERLTEALRRMERRLNQAERHILAIHYHDYIAAWEAEDSAVLGGEEPARTERER